MIPLFGWPRQRPIAEMFPLAQVKVLDAGHFALDTKLDEIADIVNHFLSRMPKAQ
jgi:hypothetical protein